eukprot:TRINITY_DN5939_c0_g1_i2.p1 TRINITY_DN5939_c0_g1~~TRINITY_DN5939_c0_g1_i2.p1  ORF type:complete len:443 (+),score=77.97 TRINITY_DN5939_c0_g1_i2:198-1331(+)
MDDKNISHFSYPREENYQSATMNNQKSEMNIISDCQPDPFKGLGSNFKKLGFLMVDVGLLLAKICDQNIGGIHLEKTILESFTAKGRLIHYHSDNERALLMNSSNRMLKKKSCKNKSGLKTMEKNGKSEKQSDNLQLPHAPDLWQQWHYDYGIFTLITSPLFLLNNDHSVESGASECPLIHQTSEEVPPPCGHTCLKILHRFLGKVMCVQIPSGALIIQVGEAAQILSGGKLHATAHCVCKPTEKPHLSRETFVVFLQPAWTKCLSSPSYPKEAPSYSKGRRGDKFDTVIDKRERTKLTSLPEVNDYDTSLDTKFKSTEEHEVTDGEPRKASEIVQEIENMVPSLVSRWTEGQTFAEFSRMTTSQYYGVKGVQSKRL